MNNDDWERLRNFTLYKFWGTDKEFEEAAPFIGFAVVIVIVLVIILALFSGFHNKTENDKHTDTSTPTQLH